MKKEKIVYFDILNILAALSVIFLHCNGCSHTYSDTLAWKQSFLVETLCYFAVPIFLMLSGATLMNYRERYTTKEFFKKRFLRTVVPFIIWTVLSAVVKGINPFSVGLKTFFNMFMNTEIEAVYWFFPCLFTFYLALPALSLLKDNKKVLWYLAAGGVLINTLIPSLLSYIGLSFNGSITMQLSLNVLLFPIIGYLFANTEFKKSQRIIIYALGIFGAALRYFGTWILSAKDGVLNQTFFGYYGYFSVFLACAVFTFAKYFKPFKKLQSNEKAAKILSTISGCSLGIYLIHMMVFGLFSRFIELYSWQWRLLVPFLIYITALLIVFIIKKIPILKHIVP